MCRCMSLPRCCGRSSLCQHDLPGTARCSPTKNRPPNAADQHITPVVFVTFVETTVQLWLPSDPRPSPQERRQFSPRLRPLAHGAQQPPCAVPLSPPSAPLRLSLTITVTASGALQAVCHSRGTPSSRRPSGRHSRHKSRTYGVQRLRGRGASICLHDLLRSNCNDCGGHAASMMMIVICLRHDDSITESELTHKHGPQPSGSSTMSC
jgi:hypothetical protein